MKANYHTHTKRCGHATGEDREYVEAAIKGGYEVLGFSDHCPWVYEKGYRSGIRLTPAEVDGYFASLEGLREEYKKDIRILIGFETEYLPALIPAQEKLLADYPLDYQIIGQHFLGPDEEQVYVGAPFQEEAYLERYVALASEGISTGKYLYMAHPDLPHFLGSDKVYRKHMLPLCQLLKEKNIPLEINVLVVADKRHYPAPRFWELARETGNRAILGIDAHAPSQLLNDRAVAEAKQFCETYGLELVESLCMG